MLDILIYAIVLAYGIIASLTVMTWFALSVSQRRKTRYPVALT